MKKVLSAAFALALCSSMALADVPSEANSSVQPADALNGVVCCPNIPSALAASVNTITVKNDSNQPIANASVVVLLTAANNICPAAVLTGTTNASGIVTITVAAGGCADGVPSAAVIKANGVTFRQYANCKSPDYDGAAGNGLCNLADLIAFSAEFNALNPAGCHDYTNDSATNLSDLIIFGEGFSGAKHCP